MTTSQCSICGLPLTKAESIENGCGPVCAEKRQAVLSSCGVSEDELTAWSADSQANRWVTLAFKAVQANRRRDVQQFFNAARRAMLACAA